MNRHNLQNYFSSDTLRLSTCRARGYTLVEMLVTIVIVAILSVIMITAIGKARTMANKAKNISNLKSIAAACHVYAGDNNGKMPNIVYSSKGAQMTQGPVLWNNSGMHQNLLSLLSNSWDNMSSNPVWGSDDYITPDSFYSPLTPNITRISGRLAPYSSNPSQAFLISYVYYSLPVVDHTVPQRSPLAPNLFNDNNVIGSSLGSSPLLSDVTTQAWANLVGGFNEEKISCVHMDGSVSQFNRDKIFQLPSNDKIRFMAGVLRK